MHMQNGTLEFDGVAGMRAYYEKVWVTFDEELHVERYVSDEHSVAIQMWTHFTAHRDDPGWQRDSLCGLGKGARILPEQKVPMPPKRQRHIQPASNNVMDYPFAWT
jgi:hypothetical protein